MSDPHRCGFKLLDVGVLATLVVLCASALLPAVMAARTDARARTCSDSLRQLGIALHNYEIQFSYLPPVATGHDDADTNDLPGENHPEIPDFNTFNWVYLLLPYLGQQDLANSLDRKLPMYDPANEKIRTAELSVMTCPEDAYHRVDNLHIRRMGAGNLLKEVRYARGNYGINCGTDCHCQCYYPGTLSQPCFNGFRLRYSGAWTFEWLGNGVAGYNKPLRLKAFTNGISRIVAIEELRAGLRPVDGRGVWALAQWGADSTFAHGLHEDNGGPNCVTGRGDQVKGCPQLIKIVGKDTLMKERMPCWPEYDLPQRATARSMHPGGVHVLVLDGSSHFVSDAVDPIVWHVMHSRTNPESVELPWK